MALRLLGFGMVHAEDLSLAKQYALFREATVVVGPKARHDKPFDAERLVGDDLFAEGHPCFHALVHAAGMTTGSSSAHTRESEIPVPARQPLARHDALSIAAG